MNVILDGKWHVIEGGAVLHVAETNAAAWRWVDRHSGSPIARQRAAVLAVLQQTGQPMWLMEIAAVLQIKPNNVSALLLRMRSDGQVQNVCCDDGWWRWSTS
jgi:hypothetical protein